MSALPHGDKLPVVFITDVMQDVRMVEGFAQVFDLVVLSPLYLRERFITWPTSASFTRTFLKASRLGFVLKATAWLLANRGRYEVVIAQDNLTAALAANLSSLVTRRPVILRMGRTTTEYFKSKRGTQMAAPLYWTGLMVVRSLVWINERLARAVGATSRYIGDESRKRNRDVRLIPAYGVDTSRFRPHPTREEARRQLGLPLDGKIALWRSRLAPEKDPETYFRALRILRDEMDRDVLGLYVGAEYQDLLARAAPFGVPIEARDAVHPDQLHLFYRAADVAVQTSKVEGFGLSPLEAMACGTPVVASAVGGLVETVVDGETGFAVPAGDANATASAIAKILDSPETSERLATQGRRMVEERYSDRIAFALWKELAEELSSEYRRKHPNAPRHVR